MLLRIDVFADPQSLTTSPSCGPTQTQGVPSGVLARCIFYPMDVQSRPMPASAATGSSHFISTRCATTPLSSQRRRGVAREASEAVCGSPAPLRDALAALRRQAVL